MENIETLTTLGTQDTEQRHQKLGIKRKICHNNITEIIFLAED